MWDMGMEMTAYLCRIGTSDGRGRIEVLVDRKTKL